MDPDAIAIAVRALAMVCLYQAAGAAFFVALFTRELPAVSGRICALGAGAALSGGLLVLLQPSFEAARMAGDFDGLRNPALLRLAWFSSRGAAHGVQLLGLVLIGAGLMAQRAARAQRLLPHSSTPGLIAAVLGAVLAAGALTLTGHTSVHPRRALLAPLLAAHLLIVAFWFGALWPLWLTLRLEAGSIAASVLRRFSSLAGVLVPCIALAGLGMAFVLISDVSVLRRGYGLLLATKLGIFLLLLALAALNRWRWMPLLAVRSDTARAALQRSLIAEQLLIAAVLAVTATLTALFSPED